MGDYKIEARGEVTNIAFGTTADYTYERYLAKKKMIADLEFECGILVDKYHAEMKRANIPFWFSEQCIKNMFGKDMFGKDMEQSSVKAARDIFLERCFTPGFLKSRKVEFETFTRHGYTSSAIGLLLGIGDYEYTIELPQPANIRDEKDKERLMGAVKFRVDRIHKSKLNQFVKEMESVQMPTYDWKECFKAIEATATKDAVGMDVVAEENAGTQKTQGGEGCQKEETKDEK